MVDSINDLHNRAYLLKIAAEAKEPSYRASRSFRWLCRLHSARAVGAAQDHLIVSAVPVLVRSAVGAGASFYLERRSPRQGGPTGQSQGEID